MHETNANLATTSENAQKIEQRNTYLINALEKLIVT